MTAVCLSPYTGLANANTGAIRAPGSARPAHTHTRTHTRTHARTQMIHIAAAAERERERERESRRRRRGRKEVIFVSLRDYELHQTRGANKHTTGGCDDCAQTVEHLGWTEHGCKCCARR